MCKKVVLFLVIIAEIAIVIAMGVAKKNNSIGNNPKISKQDSEFHVVDNVFDLNELKKYKLPIMINFGAEHCPTCRELFPMLEQLHKDLQGKAIVKYIDTRKNIELKNEYELKSIPTQIFFNSDGTPYIPENAEELKWKFVKDESGNIIYTMHEASLNLEEIMAILKQAGLKE